MVLNRALAQNILLRQILSLTDKKIRKIVLKPLSEPDKAH